MIRRRSKRFAAFALRSASASASALSLCWMSSSSLAVLSVAISVSSSLREDDAQERGQAQRARGQRPGLAVPGALGSRHVLLFVGHAVHEALQLLHRLRRREE